MPLLLQTMTVALESLTEAARDHPQSPARALYDAIGALSQRMRASMPRAEKETINGACKDTDGTARPEEAATELVR